MQGSSDAYEAEVRERLRLSIGDLSFAAVGRATNFHRETVRRYMTAGSPPLTFLRAVCLQYGISANWLLLGVDPRRSSDIPAAALRSAPTSELFSEVGRRLERMGSTDTVPLLRQAAEIAKQRYGS